MMPSLSPDLRSAADLIGRAERVFVLAGAGMGTESGIPDFRGPGGLWTRDPAAQRMFDLDAYRSDPQLREAAWRLRMASEIRTAAPNAGHVALARWEEERTVTIATQNIDGLQQRAGSTTVLELHGTYWEWMCLTCDRRGPVTEAFARVAAGEPDPACVDCGGILKSGTVAFGQPLPRATWDAAVAAARGCDVAVAIGTTLAVQPAASLCSVAVSAGAPLIIINGEATPYDDVATVTLHERIGPTLTALTRAWSH